MISSSSELLEDGDLGESLESPLFLSYKDLFYLVLSVFKSYYDENCSSGLKLLRTNGSDRILLRRLNTLALN